ncbi:hypothetical protein B0F90DRAFT_1670576 [Multifurca ochricompacta]|uniref:DUF6533 domain-containing protein n=1 Tax=Multifurca ochricompacta TaxID=376703 RepID=A0AAD4LXL3_9AGAM|nr:hypothetical protein B0F90DRAFT_1670576 [Multifurca ochricompacta]
MHIPIVPSLKRTHDLEAPWEWPGPQNPTFMIVAAIFTIYFSRLIAFSILYYDYIITLSAEVEFFWPKKRRLTWPSALFLLNRYLAILGHIPVIFEVFAGASLLSNDLVIATIYKNNRIVIAALLGILVGGGATASSSAYVIGQRGLAFAWGVVLLFDLAIFGLTTYKAMRIGWGQPMTLIYVLVRDGTIYFAWHHVPCQCIEYFDVYQCIHILNVSTDGSVSECVPPQPTLKGVNSILTSVACSTIVSRMMINLRQRIATDPELPEEYTSLPAFREGRETVLDLRASYVDKHCVL